MFYRCTQNLYSVIFKNLKKFTKDGIYECVGKDVYLNDQNMMDMISYEGWQPYFVPFEIDISEITEILEQDLQLS